MFLILQHTRAVLWKNSECFEVFVSENHWDIFVLIGTHADFAINSNMIDRIRWGLFKYPESGKIKKKNQENLKKNRKNQKKKTEKSGKNRKIRKIEKLLKKLKLSTPRDFFTRKFEWSEY